MRPGRSSARAQIREGASGQPTAGRSALEQLDALVAGHQDVLMLIGGSLNANVADATLIEAALSRAHVIAVTGHGAAELAHADVVFPAAITHERIGTITNIEGRVSAVAAKVAAPGSAWNDVAIASELAETLGSSIGLDSIEHAATTIEATTGYPAASVLAGPTSEGAVVGRLADSSPRRALDPMAFPGIRSAEMVGLAPRGGAVHDLGASETSQCARVTMADVVLEDAPSVALADSYALRVVASRRLYDRGAVVLASEALANLVEPTSLAAHPYDLDRLGAVTGDVVRVVTAKGSFELDVTSDSGVTRGTVQMALNSTSGGFDVVGSSMIESASSVTEIRLESR
jgi:formate dehydrogenase major subunit